MAELARPHRQQPDRLVAVIEMPVRGHRRHADDVARRPLVLRVFLGVVAAPLQHQHHLLEDVAMLAGVALRRDLGGHDVQRLCGDLGPAADVVLQPPLARILPIAVGGADDARALGFEAVLVGQLLQEPVVFSLDGRRLAYVAPRLEDVLAALVGANPNVQVALQAEHSSRDSETRQLAAGILERLGALRQILQLQLLLPQQAKHVPQPYLRQPGLQALGPSDPLRGRVRRNDH